MAADLPDFKVLRDAMLFAHPDAFTSDAETERRKEPADYLQRLGLARRDGGHFLLGAWIGARLVGALGCEREARLKVRHIGHVVGMMVQPDVRGRGVARALLDACIGAARQAPGLEILTLNVTAGNAPAVALYASSGFTVYGSLPRAIKVGATYHDKLHMRLDLQAANGQRR